MKAHLSIVLSSVSNVKKLCDVVVQSGWKEYSCVLYEKYIEAFTWPGGKSWLSLVILLLAHCYFYHNLINSGMCIHC